MFDERDSEFFMMKLVLFWWVQLNFMLCWSLNDEGIALLKFRERVVEHPFEALSNWTDDVGETNHCPWFGIECANGHVVSLHNGWRSRETHLHPRILSRKLLAQPSQKTSSPIRSHSGLISFLHPPSAQGPLPLMNRRLPKHDPIESLPTETPKNSPTPNIVSHLPPHASRSRSSSGGKTNWLPAVAAGVGGLFGLILVIGICVWRRKKITDVAPWTSGLSGQLQNAFVTGIPNLKKSELETACEDFSNIIGSSSLGTIYKGTLSDGVEITVISLPVTSTKGWSRSLERQFRKKIETLSKVNHKNFVNLIGCCDEKKLFSRMLVFEYAPNGSLFEHLHIKEAEHLDWGMRLRIIMGMAYCLEHMHQLTPLLTHPNFTSCSVKLSEDYAAKISDFNFWNEVAQACVQPVSMDCLSPSSASPESNVYSFGLVLLEMMTGRTPNSPENDSLENWVSGYLLGMQPLQALVDPMLKHFNPEQLEKISEVIRKCLHPERKRRPTMRDVTARLREITGISRDTASPRVSPLWWAELEIRSVNGE